MSRFSTFTRGVAIAVLGIVALVPGMSAQDAEVDQVITGGSLSASVANASLTPLAYSNTAQTSTGTLALSVSDARGVGTGWNVTIQAGDFVYSGSSPLGQAIPASGFQTTAAGTVTVVAGQAAPLPTAGSFGALNAARTVLSAAEGSGSGDYAVDLSVSLAVPAQSQTGTYTSELTVSITDGP